MLEKIDAAIKAYYEKAKGLSPDLVESILYSVDAGGKRIRPLMFLQLLQGFGLDLTVAHYDVAAAVEMIHTGSLIHDDLPAMDNDDYRRGRLTNHKKFDEATAILAGDSLFLDPFGLLAKAALAAEVKLALIEELSDASGTYGMVAGQMLDMKGEEQDLNLDQLKTIHANKTGKLLAFPFVAAGLVSQQSATVVEQLRQAGSLIGLAFQIRDDILDVTASFEELGKTPNKDVAADKSTYPALLGLEGAHASLTQALDEASAIFAQLQQEQGFDPSEIMSSVERLRLNG